MESVNHFLSGHHRLRRLCLPLCFLSLVILDLAVRGIYGFLGDTALTDWRPCLFTLFWALLLTALLSLLPKPGRRIVMIILDAVFLILCVTHGALYNVTGHLFSFSDLNYAGDGVRFFSWSYMKFRKLYLLALLLSVLLMAASVVTAGCPPRHIRTWKSRVLALLLALACVFGLMWVHNACLPNDQVSWDGEYDPDSQALAYQEFTDPNRCMNLTGLYQYTARDLAVSLGLVGSVQDAEKLERYFNNRRDEISGENEMTGTLEGKNFIMVMMESVDSWLVTEAYMPNLYRLQQEGVDFTQFYTPLYISAGTFNTEIISLTGLIPAASGLSGSAYTGNSFPLSLPHLFAAQGYSANSFHSSVPKIYNRGEIHENLGFAAYHSYADMGMDDYQLDSQMIRGYDQMTAGEPFFTYIITYSGHGPYTEEMGNIAAPHYAAARAAVENSGVTGSPENMEEYTRAVAHAMETDQFIGELVERLRQEGHLSEDGSPEGDTVLLFYADHYGKYMTDKDFLDDLKGVSEEAPVQRYHTPCFFYGGGLQPEKVDKICSSADLAPTIANLFRLDVDRAYYFGDDIFGGKGGVVMLPGDAWYDGKTYCSAGSGEKTAERRAVSAQVRERMNAAADVLKCDYFRTREAVP